MFSCQRSQNIYECGGNEMNTKKSSYAIIESICVDGITITMDLMTQVLWHTLSRRSQSRIWQGISARARSTYVIISIYFQCSFYTNEFKWLCHSKAILPNTSDNPTANPTLHAVALLIRPAFFFALLLLFLPFWGRLHSPNSKINQKQSST